MLVIKITPLLTPLGFMRYIIYHLWFWLLIWMVNLNIVHNYQNLCFKLKQKVIVNVSGLKMCFIAWQEKEARDIEIPNIRWEVFELMMRSSKFCNHVFYYSCSVNASNNFWTTYILFIWSLSRFVYCGSVDVTLDIAQDLLRAADQYLLEGLKRLCEYTIAQVS